MEHYLKHYLWLYTHWKYLTKINFILRGSLRRRVGILFDCFNPICHGRKGLIHVTSLLRKLQFFGFLAKLGVKIDPLNYNLSKIPQNMLKRITLASKKSKNNWKIFFGSLWVLILPQHVFYHILLKSRWDQRENDDISEK